MKTKDMAFISTVFEGCIMLASKNDYEGLNKFDDYKNKRASAYHLKNKIHHYMNELYGDKLKKYAEEAKTDVVNLNYGESVKEFINYVIEL